METVEKLQARYPEKLTFKRQMFSGFFLVFWIGWAVLTAVALFGIITGKADAMGIGNGWGMLAFLAFVAAVIFLSVLLNKQQRAKRHLLPYKW